MKINFVKEAYFCDENGEIKILNYIFVSGRDGNGRATREYKSKESVPKYVKSFMETHERQLFSTEYDTKHFHCIEYIYKGDN